MTQRVSLQERVGACPANLTLVEEGIPGLRTVDPSLWLACGENENVGDIDRHFMELARGAVVNRYPPLSHDDE